MYAPVSRGSADLSGSIHAVRLFVNTLKSTVVRGIDTTDTRPMPQVGASSRFCFRLVWDLRADLIRFSYRDKEVCVAGRGHFWIAICAVKARFDSQELAPRGSLPGASCIDRPLLSRRESTCVESSATYQDNRQIQEVTPLTAPCPCGDTFSVRLSSMQMQKRMIKSSPHPGGTLDSWGP